MRFRKKIFLTAALSFLTVNAFAADTTAHKKSFWESFVGFFSSEAEPEGDSDLHRQLADLENEIQDTKWRYTRETRAVRKNNLRLQLKKLCDSRDSLENVIENRGNAVPKPESSSAQVLSSSSVESNSSVSPVSSSAACESAVRTDSVFVTTTITKLVRDTVFVHDTVLVRDTVFVREASASFTEENP